MSAGDQIFSVRPIRNFNAVLADATKSARVIRLAPCPIKAPLDYALWVCGMHGYLAAKVPGLVLDAAEEALRLQPGYYVNISNPLSAQHKLVRCQGPLDRMTGAADFPKAYS